MPDAPHDPDKKAIDALIDQNLRLIYEDLLEEGLPDQIKDLLAVLKAQDAHKGSD